MRRSSLLQTSDSVIDRYINGDYSKIIEVAGSLTAINFINTNLSTIDIIAADLAVVKAVSDNKINIDKVAAIDTNVTTVADIDTDVTTVAGVSGSITTVAGMGTAINTVNANSVNVNKVAAIDTAVSSVALVDTDVTAVAGITSNVTTVAGISADVTSVAGVSSNVTIIADNLTNVNSFANTYIIDSVEPVGRSTGSLWYDTTNLLMKVYNGVYWELANTATELTKLNVDALSVDAGTVNSLTVETAVPVGALFTDTVYDDTTLSTIVTGHTGLIAGNTNSILQLAKSSTYGAFGTTGISLSVTSTPKVLPFSVITQSSNTDRFEINNDNTITAKVSGTYVFTSTINVEDTGGNGSVVPLTFRITDGTTIWYTEVVEVEISGYDRDTIAVNSLVVLPPEATVPANAYITVSCPLADNGDYTIVGFHSILSTEKSLAELQGLASSILVEANGGLSESTLQYLLENLQSSIDVLESSTEADLSGLEV